MSASILARLAASAAGDDGGGGDSGTASKSPSPLRPLASSRSLLPVEYFAARDAARSPPGDLYMVGGSSSPETAETPGTAEDVATASMAGSTVVAGSTVGGTRGGFAASAASLQLRMQIRHQREVRRLFSSSLAEVEAREAQHRRELEQVAIEHGLLKMHAAFVKERAVFVAHGQSKVAYVEMMSRHRLQQDCLSELELLHRFTAARVLPVKIEALQVKCLQVQCFMWLVQGASRAELQCRIHLMRDEAVEFEGRVRSQAEWATHLVQLAQQTFVSGTKKVPHVTGNPLRRVSEADVALVKAQWRHLHCLSRLEELRRERSLTVIQTMIADVELVQSAERIRIGWEEEEHAKELSGTAMLLSRACKQLSN